MIAARPELDKAYVPSLPVLLLVEGKHDATFFEFLRVNRGIAEIEIFAYEGKDNLRQELGDIVKGLRRGPGFSQVTSFGVVRDADTDAAVAEAVIKGALEAAGLDVPPAVVTRAGLTPAVTYMVLPDAASLGALEELCFRSLAADPALACVGDYFDCLEAITGGDYRSGPKQRMRVLLSPRRHEETLDRAIVRGYVPMGSTVFDEAAAFLAALVA